MKPYYADATVRIFHGDCLDVLRELPDASVDAVVTDPPAGISFMGKTWDSNKGGREQWSAWLAEVMREAYRVAKPGAHAFVWALPRTSHWTACGLEDAGWVIRDRVAHHFGSGFPKSHNLTGEWEGWGTALKPATEDWWLARKPLAGTVAANVLAHGTGALNVDGCRVGDTVETWPKSRNYAVSHREPGASGVTIDTGPAPAGRWPANVVLDESQAAALDAQSGESVTPRTVTRGASLAGKDGATARSGGAMERREDVPCHGDSDGASRFFYTAKAASNERVRLDGTAHPTVKPLTLMRWLVRLVTPPGGTVLEPFAGSGTTVEACILEGFACIAIEREADYLPLIRQRIHRRRDPVEAVRGSGEDAGLFDLLGGEGA